MNSSNTVYAVVKRKLSTEELGQQVLLFDSTANQHQPRPTQHLTHRHFLFKIQNTRVHEYMHCLGG